MEGSETGGAWTVLGREDGGERDGKRGWGRGWGGKMEGCVGVDGAGAGE